MNTPVDASIEECNEAIALNPEDAEAYNQSGFCLPG